MDGSITTVSVWVKFCVFGTVHLVELDFVYVHVENGPEWLLEVSTVSALSEDLWTVIPNHLDQLGDKMEFHDQGVGVEKRYPPLKPL